MGFEIAFEQGASSGRAGRRRRNPPACTACAAPGTVRWSAIWVTSNRGLAGGVQRARLDDDDAPASGQSRQQVLGAGRRSPSDRCEKDHQRPAGRRLRGVARAPSCRSAATRCGAWGWRRGESDAVAFANFRARSCRPPEPSIRPAGRVAMDERVVRAQVELRVGEHGARRLAHGAVCSTSEEILWVWRGRPRKPWHLANAVRGATRAASPTQGDRDDPVSEHRKDFPTAARPVGKAMPPIRPSSRR